MKVIVEYDPASGNVTANGMTMFFGINLDLPKAVEEESEVLKLVKQGLSAEDLINLKKQDLIK